MEENVFRSLKFSYDRLLDDKVRQGFLYCSLFPEDYPFNRNRLITYWIGEGIIKELDSSEAELDKGHCMIDELINASLFEHESRYGRDYIKMHDVVRDMALIVIRENSKPQDGLKVHGETKMCVNLESVLFIKNAMLGKGVPNLPSNCSRVTTLLLFFNYIQELPSCFFANMQNLAVLDLDYMQDIMLLPDSISYLENLRVLCVAECKSLEYIPSLAELKNLRYLELNRTNLKEIPKGMEGLINLKVLKMSSVGSLDAFFSCVFLKNLSNLQMLEIDTVELEEDVIVSLKKLETLRIVFYNLESLNSYFKSGHWKILKAYFIVYLPGKGMNASELWREETEPKKVLHIEELGDIGGGKGETNITLPNNVQKLVLGCWNGPMADVVKNSTFHNLRELEIRDYEDRQPVFTPASVERVLLNVEELIISDGDYVEEIISGKEELVGEINNYYYPTIHLPKLKYLSLMDLTNLKSIYKGTMVCPSLEGISIFNCEKIERLPFCMKDRNNLNPILLQLDLMSSKWWDSLHWDDAHAKSFYQVEGHYESEDDDPIEEDDESVDSTLKP